MANLKYKHTAYTSAQWASLNPVIVENEIVIESDTKRTKIGNGISTYNQLEYADANSIGNSLGSIKPTDAAPTPARNGNYTFSIGGNKPEWLTAEPLVTEVKAGDGVAVVYDGVSAYTYTHVDVSIYIEQVRSQATNKVPSSKLFDDEIVQLANEVNLKEVKANKQNSLEVDGTGTKFPTVDAVNAMVKQTVGTSTTQVMSQDAVTKELLLKFNKLDVVGELGSSETKVLNQKKVSEEFSNKLEKIKTVEPGYYITDSLSNILLKIDNDGLDVVKISNHFLQLLEDMGISSGSSISGIHEIFEESFVIADPTGKIGFKFSKEGFVRFDETCELLSEIEYQI